jgi:hypothetical protein
MNHTAADKDLLWEQQQRIDKTRKDVEFHEWWKKFALVFALVALTVSVATLLARQG